VSCFALAGSVAVAIAVQCLIGLELLHELFTLYQEYLKNPPSNWYERGRYIALAVIIALVIIVICLIALAVLNDLATHYQRYLGKLPST
jgi:predicted PurR-regulated permease PerM